MKKNKVLALGMAVCMAFGLLTGCGQKTATTEPATTETTQGQTATTAPEQQTPVAGPFKIGVATIHEGEAWEVQKAYYETEVGPALNMEFVFSEKLEDANGLVDFMDRAYASGCVGIINYVTSNDAVAQGARKAEDWGVYFLTASSRLNEDVAELSYNLGHCGASAPATGAAYKKAFTEILNDGENHSVFIFAGAAVGGMIGQGAASHYYSVQGILEAMQESYGLTYEASIDELINKQDPGEVATGNPDVKIYIYPGLDVNAAVTAAQTQFQTGEYDTFAAVFSFPAFTTMLADVESSLNTNIKVVATAQIEAQTETGFTTTDPTGDTILNAVVINPLNVQNGINAVLMYNALTGYADVMKENGKALLFGIEQWSCMSADVYKGLSGLDTSTGYYILGAEDLKALCVDQNPNITYKDIQNKLLELADAAAVVASKQ